MSFNPIGDIKRALSKAEHAVEDLGKRAKHDIEGAANSAKHGIESAANSAKHDLEGAAKKARHDIEGAAHEVQRTFEQRLPALVEDALHEAIRAAASGALTKAVDIIQVAAPDEVDLTVGPITLAIGDLKERIDTLQKWARRPPTGKGEIRQIIEEVAPSSVSVNLSFSLALVVVQTDSLECGVNLSWETAKFLDKFEDILGHTF